VGANPRGVAVSADGKYVAVANRLDDSISLIDTRTDSVSATISLLRAGEKPLSDRDSLIRQGERLFSSGAVSFGGQFSCASCHPDGLADGLNWDLPADGFNNFLNTKSLRGSALTAPYGWRGTSPTLRDRFTGTLRHLFQHEPTASETESLEAYLVTLAHPSRDGELPADVASGIARGRTLFGGAAGCSTCHTGEKFTDRRLHDVGTGASGETFDTPTLLGITTTPPYLHDGRAPTLEAVFGEFNAAGLHGQARDLTAGQLADLLLYLISL
jgi:YVTN family beta-propeller protein